MTIPRVSLMMLQLTRQNGPIIFCCWNKHNAWRFSYSNKTSCPPAGHSSIGQSIFEAIAGAWKFSPGRQNERSKCVKYSLRIFNKLCFFITRRRPESNHSLFFVSIRQEPILEASKASWRVMHSLLWKGRSCALIIFIFQRIWCVPYYLCCLLEKQLI